MKGFSRLPLLIGILATFALLAAVACGGETAPTPTATKAAPAPTPTPTGPRGTVKVALIDFGRERLGPGGFGMGNRGFGGNAMFDPLIGVNSDGSSNFDNGLLKSLDTPDGQVYTLTLKQGIKFHNGTELTSEDVRWTIDYFVNTKEIASTAATFFRANLDRMEISDKYTLKIYLKSIDVNFPTILAPIENDLVVYPKDYFLSAGVDGFEAKPIGTGPFKFVSHRLGEYFEYVANEDYWNPKGIPGFKTLRLELVPDIASRKAKLKTGEVDLIQVDPKDAPQVTQEGFKIVGPKYTSYPMVNIMNSWDPKFLTNKLEFRKAMVLAVDMDAVVKAFYPPGTGDRAAGTPGFSPITLGYDKSLPPYPYDPAESKRLLAQIGYKGEEVSFFSFTFPGIPEMPEVNVAIANYLRQAGFNVKLNDVEWTSFGWTTYKYQPPAAIVQSGTQPRPSLLGNIRVYLLGKGDGGVVAGHADPPKIKEAYDRIRKIVDATERDKALREFNKALYEDYWAFPIVWRHGVWAAGARIADWQPVSGTSDFLRWNTLKPSDKVTQ